MGGRIHGTAIVEGATLGDDVEVGPYAIVGPGVRLGPGSRVLAHAVLLGHVDTGKNNEFYPFSVVGAAPQHRRHGGDAGVVLGDDNVVREHVTVHSGTEGQRTVLGSENLLMVGCHVAHDVRLGSRCTVANGVQIAGHAVIDDYVTFGGLSAVAQHVRIGENAFVAGGAMCERSVPAFVTVQGDRARVRALNVVGLRRRGVPESSIAALRAAFRRVFFGGRPRAELLAEVASDDPYVERFLRSLREASAPTR